MAKKSKSSFMNIIWGILTLAGLVLLIMPTFLSIFDRTGTLGDRTEVLNSYGLFADLSIYESGGLATAVSVMLIIGLCLAAIYLILYCIDSFAKVKFDCSKIRMFIAFLLLALFVATLICGLVFANGAISANLGDIASTSMVCGAGFWLGVIGMLVASVFGFLAAKK